MYKSPKYKSINTNTIKDRQKYFKNLYDEVNKSRMAVETITSFKNTQMNFKKKIDQIQQQLQSSISRINLQTKKNVVLKQLITLMKGQMFNFQKTQKRQQQKNQSEIQKKIKKVQYDIEQILQKHNQQIAKITSLKQNASSGRSERVVFSNLFKKLEKEIKQNQELYKQNLIKSQIAKDKSKPTRSVSRAVEKQNTDFKLQNNRHSQTNIDIFPMDSKFLQSNDHGDAFITLQRQRSFQGQAKKRTIIQKQMGHSQVYELKSSSRGFSQMISCYQNFIQKIKVYMGFSDIQEAICFYDTIQLSNQNLASQIQCFNQEISKFQISIKQINSQKRQSQCYQNSKQLPLGSCRRIKMSTDHIKRQEQSSQQLFDILTQINKIVTLDFSNNQINQDTLKSLDSKLDLILEDSKLNQIFFNEDTANNNRATTATTQGNVVDILLQKMDRFSQCEKILDRNLFKQQYVKELGKTKKHKTKK